ncbi:putative zinc finger MYM domain containing 1 [Danaus plexippus plexippus]|uniref:Zinc finger MYM domain containing 1 n=1 Tax=Danaus plexippus plexippus TaxID=278856 RepID=A0A212FKU0_DANPL|nr:putative zinc finger MYM domain containing 1 [Danaus plexippus plexippus]
MPRGIHTSKRQSGFQQRKAKKAKMDEIQSMSGSLFKYVTKADSVLSSSKVPESSADESNDSHLEDSHSNSIIDNTESLKTTHYVDGTKINNESDTVNATFADSISFEESVQHLRDVSHWSLPVPNNVRIDIIKKGSEHFQNKEGPFPTVSRHGSKIKGDSRHLSQLVNEIKSAKYFGIMFDSTPDCSHIDQMSEVIRYVKIYNRKVEVKEVFLGFFPLHEKKAADLSAEILKKLENDGLDIMMCRSQGYDNAAVMSDIHGGVQAIIKEKIIKQFLLVV